MKFRKLRYRVEDTLRNKASQEERIYIDVPLENDERLIGIT